MLTFAAVATQQVVPFAAVSLALVVVVGGLLLWTRALRASYDVPGNVVFGRGPAKPLIGAIVAALCFAVAPWLGLDGSNGIVWGVLVFGVFALVFALQFLAYSLVFYVADGSGLIRQVLVYKQTLPWQTIDWVYPERKTTSMRAYGVVKVGQSSQGAMVVEAGAKRRIRILLTAWLVGGDASQLLEAIQERARGADFGYDRSPFVIQRRRAAVAAPTR